MLHSWCVQDDSQSKSGTLNGPNCTEGQMCDTVSQVARRCQRRVTSVHMGVLPPQCRAQCRSLSSFHHPRPPLAAALAPRHPSCSIRLTVAALYLLCLHNNDPLHDPTPQHQLSNTLLLSPWRNLSSTSTLLSSTSGVSLQDHIWACADVDACHAVDTGETSEPMPGGSPDFAPVGEDDSEDDLHSSPPGDIQLPEFVVRALQVSFLPFVQLHIPFPARCRPQLVSLTG